MLSRYVGSDYFKGGHEAWFEGLMEGVVCMHRGWPSMFDGRIIC